MYQCTFALSWCIIVQSLSDLALVQTELADTLHTESDILDLELEVTLESVADWHLRVSFAQNSKLRAELYAAIQAQAGNCTLRLQLGAIVCSRNCGVLRA